MNKKGAELSMNVIIIAAIGVLVLVILAVLVINAGAKAKTGTESCNVKGGVCKTDCGTAGPLEGGTYNCAEGQYCCKVFAVEG